MPSSSTRSTSRPSQGPPPPAVLWVAESAAVHQLLSPGIDRLRAAGAMCEAVELGLREAMTGVLPSPAHDPDAPWTLLVVAFAEQSALPAALAARTGRPVVALPMISEGDALSPRSALEACLGADPRYPVLVAPVSQPLATAAWLEHLLGGASGAGAGARAAAPSNVIAMGWQGRGDAADFAAREGAATPTAIAGIEQITREAVPPARSEPMAEPQPPGGFSDADWRALEAYESELRRSDEEGEEPMPPPAPAARPADKRLSNTDLAEAVARQLREIEELRLERQVQDELRDGFSWKRGAETRRSVVAEAFEQERHEQPREAPASTPPQAAPRPPQREKATPPPRPVVDRECRPEEPDFVAPRPLAAVPPPGASRPQVLTTGLDAPSPKVLDRIHDVVLEGGVVALPTETGYVLACDATSRSALARLREVAALPDEHPLMLMVQNLAMVQAIVRHLPRGLDSIFEDLWPGPLAVRFRRPRALFQAASPGDTIVLRYSPSPITGLLLDLIVRPLAVLDAGAEGDPLPLFLRQPCFDSASVRQQFGANLDVLLDAGVLPESRRVTVLAAQEPPYVLEFEGAIARQRIEGRLNAGELAPPPAC